MPEVGYYYPEPHWRLEEIDELKNLLLFFDGLAILLPRYMHGREVAEDPVLAGPLAEQGLLTVLEPEDFVDQQMTEALHEALVELITADAFADLDPTSYYAELSRSRLGWNADVSLSSMVIEELERRGLARPSEDGVSVPLHPAVRKTVLVLLSQLARETGHRHGLDLHPVTSDHSAVDALIEVLSLSPLPSSGHIVALDLEAVSLNLAPVPLDEVIGFRDEHGAQYREYARTVRRTIIELSPLPPDDRSRLLMDRREELADLADSLRRTARRSWRRPLANVAVGGVGAAWQGAAYHDPIGAALALGAGLLGALGSTPVNAGAYSYLFQASRELAR
jgi:hypothetical protein